MTITVKELQELLSIYHPDDMVILAKDREGNTFSPLDLVGDTFYQAETTWSGMIVNTPDDESVPCVALYPTR